MSSTLAEDSKIQYPVSELSKVQLGVSMAYPTCDCTHLIMEVGLNEEGSNLTQFLSSFPRSKINMRIALNPFRPANSDRPCWYTPDASNPDDHYWSTITDNSSLESSASALSISRNSFTKSLSLNVAARESF
jgi:hypothetical protein